MSIQDLLCKIDKHDWDHKNQNFYRIDDTTVVAIMLCKNCEELKSHAWRKLKKDGEL